MRRLSAFSITILVSFIFKSESIDKLVLKEANSNHSDINEIEFYSKKEYLFENFNKSYDVISNNYLNYRDVYGLRYSPKRKFMKTSFDNREINEDNHTINDANNNFIVTTSTTTIEGEAISPIAGENVMESSTFQSLKENVAQSSNENNSSIDGAIDTSKLETNNHHIMRPNNRVEHALNFLANRMKNLIYYGDDQKIHGSKAAPHLLTLGKFLNLFSTIRFDNMPCLTGRKPMRQLSGTCLNEVECINFGGITMDRCANGFGVCCVFKSSCGHVTHQNVTYFQSPDYPLTSQNNLGTCTLTILLSQNVKQLFLEFIFFETLPPTNGNCVNDQFAIHTDSGSLHRENPIICGMATGQHIYLDVSGEERIFLSLLTQTADDRAFSIKVSQLSVYDNLAPAGCLQYFTNTDGIIKSFNYDDEYSQVLKYRNPSYFNNMNYAICIKRAQGYCSITYTNSYKGREEVFELINTDANGNIIAPGQAGAEIFGCPDDFIAVNYIRLCGYKLNDGALSINFNVNEPVKSIMNGPIVIPVKTNNETVGRGFNIYYFQEKC